MATNAFSALLELLPQDALLVGTITGVHPDGTVTIEQPAGGRQRVRGTGQVGKRVFFRAGLIEGDAPDLPLVTIIV